MIARFSSGHAGRRKRFCAKSRRSWADTGGTDTFLVDSFIDVIKGVRPATSTLEHGLLSTAIGQAAELASRENRTVFINELVGK
ncbi:MAG: hypothetical protein GXP32_01010 [Kiritimatiellaeota bacterium]|nr:hypothetical protein [Kiritimatiellota bacterium]